MLSRSAENLYWMARHVERAENAARALDAALQMSLVERDGPTRNSAWASIVEVGPEPEVFRERYGEASAETTAKSISRRSSDPSASPTSTAKLPRKKTKAVPIRALATIAIVTSQ